MTIPATPPPARFDELLGPVFGWVAVPAVIVECSVRTVTEGGAVKVTRAAVCQMTSYLVRTGAWAEP